MMPLSHTKAGFALGRAGGVVALLLLAGCSSQSAGRVVGAVRALDGPYALGQDIHILSPHGVLTVRQGDLATKLTATFTPFVDDAPSSDEAEQAMTDGLTYEVDTSGNTIVVSVTLAPGALQGLGADIAVDLPNSFNGGVELEQADGAIDAELVGTPPYTTVQSAQGAVSVMGAAGQLDVSVGGGDCTLGVKGWSASDGAVDVLAGSLALIVGAGLSGNIEAQAGAEVVGPSPLPADWAETVVADDHKRYVFGPDSALMGTVALAAPATAAVITITQQP
jgi:hypothetical protein